MRQTSSVLYIAIDGLVDSRGGFLSGFEDFTADLDRAGVPTVWVSTRTRMQLDEPRRKLGHTHPFVSEDGCGVFLPQDYFHLRPQERGTKGPKTKATVRLGRFICLPAAEQQPAAAEALEALADELRISIVPIRSLPPRELAQNLGLSQREADLARQRDFDELFFFAGAAATDIERFHELSRAKGWQLRQRGALWSLAIGANVASCVRELSKLYDRALHMHARSVALAVRGADNGLLSACDRAVLLADGLEDEGITKRKGGGPVMELPIRADDHWEGVFEAVAGKA